MMPIIMPIHSSNVAISQKDGGAILLLSAVIYIWFGFWIWLGLKLDYKYECNPLFISLTGGILLPLIVFGLIMYFK